MPNGERDPQHSHAWPQLDVCTISGTLRTKFWPLDDTTFASTSSSIRQSAHILGSDLANMVEEREALRLQCHRAPSASIHDGSSHCPSPERILAGGSAHNGAATVL